MARSTIDSNESRRRFAHLSLVFTTILEQYREISNRHPLVASSIDDETQSRSRRLDYNGIEYLADITAACEAAVKGQANADELRDAIDKLIAGDQTVPEVLTRQIIRLCGAVFEKRQLEPSAYLRHIKRGRGERVTQ